MNDSKEDWSLTRFTHDILTSRPDGQVVDAIEWLRKQGIQNVGHLWNVSQSFIEEAVGRSDLQLGIKSAMLEIAKKARDEQNRVERRGRHHSRRSRSRSGRRSGGKGKGRGRRQRGRSAGAGGRAESTNTHNNDKSKSPEKKPALWEAVETNDLSRVDMLIEQNVNIEETYKTWTPLMKAAESDSGDIIRSLIAARADLEAKNRKKRTALSFAACPSKDGGEERPVATVAMELLLQYGADINAKDATGRTIRQRAADEHRDEAVARLDEQDTRN
mmetsp:Transcript_81769/g.171094  ORF Transcript_81769/g.171094 Transcript_81769/m.171094 type:complete len:274 (-) Transcript_81769:351-1172(-)